MAPGLLLMFSVVMLLLHVSSGKSFQQSFVNLHVKIEQSMGLKLGQILAETLEQICAILVPTAKVAYFLFEMTSFWT